MGIGWGEATISFWYQYKQHINSIEWKRLSRKFRKKNPNCYVCNTTYNLKCHHTYYENMASDKEWYDLISLCGKCHNATHKLIDNEEVSLKNAHLLLKLKNEKSK